MPAAATANPSSDLRELSRVPGFDTQPSIDPESAAELDKMFAAKTAAKTAEPEPKPAEPAANTEPAEPPVEPAAKTEPAAEPAAKTEPAEPGEPAAKTEPAEPAAKPTDDFDAIALPPYSKPKTNESFDKLKTLARERVAAAEQERDALRKERDELATKLGAGVPVEIENELKELRTFRSKLDVEADPEFRTFDKTVADNIESIYNRLKADKFTDAHIEEIKKLGGPAEVDWDSIAGKMSPSVKRFIDAKLVENETIADKKTRAIEEAKKNADEYLRTKQAAQTDVVSQHNKQVELKVKELVPQLGWLEERKAKDGATAAEKSAVEAHNKLVAESNEFLKQATTDSSPELRSLLAVGYVQLLKSRVDITRITAESTEKIKKLESDLKELTEKYEKVKGASTARLNPSAKPENNPNPTTDNLSVPSAVAIDNLFKEKMNSR
jgi:hypothetical protein